MKSYNKGFTLVELMIVVAIIGLLSVIATYNITGGLSMQRYRAKSAAMELSSNMRKARAQAIRERRNIEIVFDVGGGTYTVDGTVYALEPGVVFGRGASGSGNAVSFVNNTLSFNVRGFSNMGYAHLKNSRGDVFRVGTRNVAGAIALQEWKDGEWR